MGVTMAGEEYVPLGGTEFSTIISKIQEAQPDAIFNTLNGDSNVAFFKQFLDAGFTAETLPVMSVSVAEEEVRGTLTFEGKTITNWPTSQRARAGLGYVPQGRGIFPYLTVFENLLMGFEATPSRTPDKSSLEGVYTLFPMIKQFRHRQAGMLSGGQQ